MTIILNLTQHVASPEQIAAGVVDCSAEQLSQLRELLTFVALPSGDDVVERAQTIAHWANQWAYDADLRGPIKAMIGGAPYLMAPLERALFGLGIRPVYAFSERVSVDLPDGRKVAQFRHLGFVDVAD